MRQQDGRGRRLQIPESSVGPAVIPGAVLGARLWLARERRDLRRGRDGSVRGPAAHEQAAGTGAAPGAPAALTPHRGAGVFKRQRAGSFPTLYPCAAEKRNKNEGVWLKRIRCWKGWRSRRIWGQEVKAVIF